MARRDRRSARPSIAYDRHGRLRRFPDLGGIDIRSRLENTVLHHEVLVEGDVSSAWRLASRRVIDDVIGCALRAAPEITVKDLRKRLSDAYPFGERRMWPYKVWSKEVRRAIKMVEKGRELGVDPLVIARPCEACGAPAGEICTPMGEGDEIYAAMVVAADATEEEDLATAKALRAEVIHSVRRTVPRSGPLFQEP